MMRRSANLAISAALLAGLATPVSGYYHYVHYLSRNAPYILAQEKFDLAALPAKTLTFFVSDNGPGTYPQNDSFSSVLSQVRQAVGTWNGVKSSDLRVAFGGLSAPGTPAASVPGGQVVFEDLPPGLLGYGGPTTRSGVVTTPNGIFVPVVRAVIHLTADLTKRPGPSYSEGFFLTAVHEMGHALGLQHTFTSSAMSTAVTRATSLTRPIDADDIAGLSVLYPAPGFGSQTGVITGRVLSGSSGVHMASVVAIRNGSESVSALTNPDGSYRIEGVPPGQYYVYAHPLPPASNPACVDICPPLDLNSKAVAPGRPFNTVFYGNTIDYTKATTISVLAGAMTDGVNFNVTSRTDVPIYGVSIYSFFNDIAVSPGYLNMAPSGNGRVLAGGSGITAGKNTAAGLKLQIMGGTASVSTFVPYTDPNGTTYLNLEINYNLGAPTGPEHLLFTQDNFLYVLPSGLNLVQRTPPFVSSVSPNPDGSVAITGTGFGSDSSVYFDGLPTAMGPLDAQNGLVQVTPPAGASGQRATVSVYNRDGQNSLFLQATAPPVFPYPVSAPPSFTITPNALPAGSEAAITITGTNTNFTAGQTVAGFGTSDVFVRQVFVLSPTQLLVNVSIPPNAVQGTTEATTIAGFQIATIPNAFTIQPPVNAVPVAIPQLSNATPGQTGAYPGALVTLNGSGLSSGDANPVVTIKGQIAPVISGSTNQLTLQLPSNLPSGPALLRVNNGANSSPAVAVFIDSAPPVVTAELNPANVAYDTVNPAHGGDVVRLMMGGFADPSAVIFPTEVAIVVGGISHQAIAVLPTAGGQTEVSFVLSNLVPSGPQTPATVYLDGRSSLQSALAVLN